MAIFDILKNKGTNMVPNYNGDVRGSGIEYVTSEINGYSNSKGNIENDENIQSTIEKRASLLHKEASTLDSPKIKDIITPKSYSQKYHLTSLNPPIPLSSNIDEGSEAKYVAPSSPSVKGKNINVSKDSIPNYSQSKTYLSIIKDFDYNISSRF
jgi:hypothetical protein